jgi:hypothetical protein
MPKGKRRRSKVKNQGPSRNSQTTALNEARNKRENTRDKVKGAVSGVAGTYYAYALAKTKIKK